MNTLLLDNKYQLAWNEYGTADGEPVFYFHGITGSRMEAQTADTIAKDLGIRLIAPDRPGYGDSDIQDGFCLLDWPNVISQLADKLRLSQFSILGFSNGGSYALACAHELAERLKHITVVGSTAPFETKAMQEHVSADFKPLYELAATDYPAALQQVTQLATSPETFMEVLQASLLPCDKTIFEQDDFYQHYLENLALAIHNGVDGMVNGLSCVSLPWQFNLEDIQTHIDIWHGRDDNLIGLPVAEYLAETLQNTSTHFLNNSGHYFLFNQWREVLGQTIK